ncbi:MAG: hypothetical protein ACKOCC_05315 [Actinomycetota bacterium]
MGGFDTEITLTGPWREPRQMLADQEYDGHASVHDEAVADKLGLAGAPIEGPTHFSQFDPLAAAVWGDAWFEYGCISSHFENMVVEGEKVRATMVHAGGESARIVAHKEDGSNVLSGTVTLGPGHAETELDRRLAGARDPGDLHIIDQLVVGSRSRAVRATMTWGDSNGNLYPFSLEDKIRSITETSPWYVPGADDSTPWGGAIVPIEMVSVLAAKCPRPGEVRGPAVGLFMDLEIRMLEGPVMVGNEYELVNEIVAVGQTRRVEHYWTRTTITDPTDGRTVCEVLLNQGVFKASFAGYPG